MDPRVLAELRKSAVTTGGVSTLAERGLSVVLTIAAAKRAQLLAYYAPKQADGNPYRFKRLDVLPSAVPEGSLSAGNSTNPTWAEVNTNLRPLRSWGSVPLFDQATIKNWNALAQTLKAHLMASAHLLLSESLYGDDILDYNAAGAANTVNTIGYMFDGFERDADMSLGVNLFQGTANTALLKADVDNLIDIASVGGTEGDLHVITCSPQMITSIVNAQAGNTGIRYNVEVNRGQPVFGGRPGFGDIKYRDRNYAPLGLDGVMYRGCILVPSDFTRPIAQMNALTASAGGSGGSIAAGTYRFGVAPVTQYGEQLASYTGDVAVTSGQKVTLTFTEFKHTGSNATYTDAILYKVYMKTTAGAGSAANYALQGTYPAALFDANGKQTAGTGAAGIVVADDVTVAQYPLTEDGTIGAVTTIDSPDEYIFNLNLSDENGFELVGATDELAQAPPESGGLEILRYVPLGLTRDARDFFIRGFVGLAVRRGRAHAIRRGTKA